MSIAGSVGCGRRARSQSQQNDAYCLFAESLISRRELNRAERVPAATEETRRAERQGKPLEGGARPGAREHDAEAFRDERIETAVKGAKRASAVTAST